MFPLKATCHKIGTKHFLKTCKYRKGTFPCFLTKFQNYLISLAQGLPRLCQNWWNWPKLTKLTGNTICKHLQEFCKYKQWYHHQTRHEIKYRITYPCQERPWIFLTRLPALWLTWLLLLTLQALCYPYQILECHWSVLFVSSWEYWCNWLLPLHRRVRIDQSEVAHAEDTKFKNFNQKIDLKTHCVLLHYSKNGNLHIQHNLQQ